MNLSDLSIKNPVFAVMLSAAMIVFGYLGYQDMGVSQFPEIDFPVVSVAIMREGAPPDIMDGDVTDVVEDAVAGVEGVHYIMSRSLEGMSLVTIFFHLTRNIDAAQQDIQNAVSAARRRLPVDIDPPIILKVNPNNLPVMWLTLSASTQDGARAVSLQQISDFAEKEFKPRISSIHPDIGGVVFAGRLQRNIRIHHDAFRLGQFNLSAEDLVQAIQKNHAELPAGVIQSKLVEANLRTMGEAYSIKDLNRIIVAQKNNQQIYLKDVAVAEDGTEDRRSFARFSRMPAVAVGIRKAIGGNLVAVCEAVKRELPQLRKMLPEGVDLHVPVDSSLFVRENVEELKLTLFLGILLTAVVCFLFLGSLGTTLNICLSIPTSLIGTFFVLRYGVQLLGVPPFTINLMTLLGLSLSVGVVVDDAILVLENIYRHREMGTERKLAAILGAREIAFAAVAATLSIMAIFLPVAFMKGTIGKFFFQFGVTVGVAVFLSLICALTLTPMLCAFFLNVHQRVPARPAPFRWPLALTAALAFLLVFSLLRLTAIVLPGLGGWAWWEASALRWLVSAPPAKILYQYPGWWIGVSVFEFGLAYFLVRQGNQLYWALDRYFLEPYLLRPTEWALARLTAGYARLLAWSLRHWIIVLQAGFLLILCAFFFVYLDLLGKELVPSEDQSRFLVHIVCPSSSSIDDIDLLIQECERRLQVRPDVLSFLSTIDVENGSLMNEVDIFVQLLPRHDRNLSQQKIMNEVREDLQKIPDIRVVLRDQSVEGFTPQRGDPVDFAILGDWQRLPGLHQKIRERMANSGMFVDIDSNYRPGQQEVRIIPDRDKLAMLNMNMAHIANSLNLHFASQRIAKYTEGGRRYDIRMRLLRHQRMSPSQLEPLLLRGGENRLVPLKDVAEVEVIATLPVVNRYNHQRMIQITASPAPGISQGEAIAKAQEITQEILPEQEFTVAELGNAQAMRETINSLMFALLLGIVIAYMILGVQFNSFIHPFTVLLAMPFAATGALATLYWTGDTLNMMSLIGLILLMGLVKKNSIILVDYTNQLREEGLSVTDAVLKACPVRLRPILMTSVATVAGAVPAAIGWGPGAETRAPMARGIIGGIVLSTLVTLFLVPVFYVLIERLRGYCSKNLLVEPSTNPPAGARG